MNPFDQKRGGKDVDQGDKAIIGAIAKYRYLYGVDWPELAAAARMGSSTLRIRMKAPETFSIGELRLIRDKLSIPGEEWAHII